MPRERCRGGRRLRGDPGSVQERVEQGRCSHWPPPPPTR